jgi:hypothetical protein
MGGTSLLDPPSLPSLPPFPMVHGYDHINDNDDDSVTLSDFTVGGILEQAESVAVAEVVMDVDASSSIVSHHTIYGTRPTSGRRLMKCSSIQEDEVHHFEIGKVEEHGQGEVLNQQGRMEAINPPVHRMTLFFLLVLH